MYLQCCGITSLYFSHDVSDGVQEVAYIHSNQNVVGSSKAENHLSRWAVHDVFELKQFSQLPANVAVCSAKVKIYFWKCHFNFSLSSFFILKSSKKLVFLLLATMNDQRHLGWEEENAQLEV